MIKRFFNLSVIALVVSVALTGCSQSDDPNYEDVIPPTVSVAPATVSGIVKAKSGAPVSGAVVKLGTLSAITDTDGYVEFKDVAAGTYTLTVTAEGMSDYEGTIVVESNTVTRNVTFYAGLTSEEAIVTQAITAAEGGEIATETEALEGNEKAEVPVVVEIPEEALSEDAEITVTPFYDESEVTPFVAPTRALSKKSVGSAVMGITITTTLQNVVIKKPIPVTYTVDESLIEVATVKKLVNGEWVEIDKTVEAGKLTFSVDAFTSYGVFLPSIDISVSKSATNALVFDRDVWDNLYGSSSQYVNEASFQYKIGTQLGSTGTTVLLALLIEKLAALYGATVKEVKGTYPLNVTLPIGTRLSISGTQEYATVTCSAGSRSVSATVYGDVTVKAVTVNRQHTGGSN